MRPPLRMLLLVLVFSLCDADSSCPIDFTLDPPEVLEEYKGSVVVNCTSSTDIHDGIYWRVGDKKDEADMDNGFVPREVELSDWNITAECTIQLNKTHSCSRELEITLYKVPQQPIVFPTNHAAALEGTPYLLQCNVDDVAPVQNLTVRWYRGNETVQTDSFTNTTKTPVSESSTLEVNVSREDDGAQFTCEAQLDFGPRGSPPPVISDVHTVSVHYAPEFKNQTEDVEVNDYDDVSLSCEAAGRPPPAFLWACDGLNVSGNMDHLNITQARISTTCFCTAQNYLGNATKQINVHVIRSITTGIPAAPAAITTPEPAAPGACPIVMTPAEIVVEFGDPASANCSTSEDVGGMGWEATTGGTGFENGPVVQWKVAEVNVWAINATCYITRPDNSQCNSSITVTVYKTPDDVSVSDPGPMDEGKEYELDCAIANVAPVSKLKVNWYRDDNLVQTAKFNGVSKTPEHVISTLKVTPESDHNGALYRCEAELQLGPTGADQVTRTETSLPHAAVVHYKPVFKACPKHFAGVERQFSLNMVPCEADGNPPPTVQWFYDGELLDPSALFHRGHAANYTVKIQNPLGSSNTSVDITIEYGPSFSCDYNYEITEKGKLPCEPSGEPKPHITWYKDGKKILRPQLWSRKDSGKYTLQATNNHGTANHTVTLNIMYPPVFKEGSYRLEMSPGQNVTIDCSAEGNPPPDIGWMHISAENVKYTSRGSQKSISITGATSTNAGVYNCTATNRVGTVTKSVTLVMKGKTSGVKVIWWILIAVVVTLILLLIYFAYKRSRKHGRYSFIPDRANESSNIPMAPQSNGVRA